MPTNTSEIRHYNYKYIKKIYGFMIGANNDWWNEMAGSFVLYSFDMEVRCSQIVSWHVM